MQQGRCVGVIAGAGGAKQGHDRQGMGVTGCGNTRLSSLRTGGIFFGDQAHEFHPLSWMTKPGESANFRHHGDGCGKLDTAQGLKGLNYRGQTPRCALLLQCLCETGTCLTSGCELILRHLAALVSGKRTRVDLRGQPTVIGSHYV